MTSSRAGWLAVAVLAGSQFLAVMSTTVVSVALPAIGTGLHASAAGRLWIVDIYVIVYSALLVVGGTIGDRRGRKGMFLLGLVLFGIGSLADSLAPSTGALLAGRVLQGLGPVLLVPGSLTIIRALFDDERRRAQAIGLWSTGSGLGMAAGPVVGGLIAAHWGWRWVFGFNVPLAVVLLLIAAWAIPRLESGGSGGSSPPSQQSGGSGGSSPPSQQSGGSGGSSPPSQHCVPVAERLDWAGTVLGCACVAAIAFALIEGNPLGWTSPPVLAGFALSAGALAAFVARERRAPRTGTAPVVDVSLFRRPAFAVANVAALVVFFAFIGAIVFLSAYFQQVRGDSPVAAGLQVAVLGVAFAVTAPLSGRLTGRVGARWPMVAGLVAAAAAMFGLLRLGPQYPDTGAGATWWDFAVAGAGVGLCLTPMTQVAVSAVPASRAGMASSAHNALRQFGQVLGVAVLGAIIYAHGSRGFVTGLHAAMWLSGTALLGAAVLAIALLRPEPGEPRSAAPPARQGRTEPAAVTTLRSAK